MSQGSKIEWTDATWNPVRGCTKVSAGCKNCYAETFAERWRGIPGHPFEQGFDLKLVPEKLGEPLKWKKPRRIFVNSMSDLFHEKIPFEYIDQVWRVMAEAFQHTFQILTKRPARMLEFFEWTKTNLKKAHMDEWWKGYSTMPHVHFGVSVENQRAADERIPLLLRMPAAVRFISCEPLLEHVILTSFPDWVIVGGESGHGARQMDPTWARSLRDQCSAAGVPFFMKQMDKKTPIPPDLFIREFPR
jgi:protein gp37